MQNFDIIIPAAGLGSRLGSNKPKILTEFNDGEFLYQKQINVLTKVFHNIQITYIIGFESDKAANKLKKEKVDICYNKNYFKNNTAFSIKLALEKSQAKNSLIIYGDLLFNTQTFKKIEGSGSKSFLILDRINFDDDEVGINSENGPVTLLDYGFDNRWGQILYLKENDKKEFIVEANKLGNERKFTFEIINTLINKKDLYFDVIEPSGSKIIEIDCPSDINKCNQKIKENFFI